MTASTLPPMPPEIVPLEITYAPPNRDAFVLRYCMHDDYRELRSWAEACRAERDALEGKLKVAVDQLKREFDKLTEYNRGTTHWPGCESQHPRCRAIAEIEHTLAAIGLPDSSNSQGQEGG